MKRLKMDYEDLVAMSADLQRRWEALLEAVRVTVLSRDADSDPWIRIRIIKGGSGSVWRDTNPDPGHIRTDNKCAETCHGKKLELR